MTETAESPSPISLQQCRFRLEKNCDRFSKGQRLSIETVFPVQNSLPNLGRFQEEPLLMEAFGPCLPNNRAGGEFIRLPNIKIIVPPLIRNVLDGKPDGVSYYD